VWINPQNAILFESRMDVNVKMRNLLESCFTNGVPETQSFIRECCRDSPRYAGERRHEGSATRFIQLSHITQVLARDDEGVAGVKLPKIDKGHGQLVLKHHADRETTLDNFAKDAFVALRVMHGANKIKIGCRWQEQACRRHWSGTRISADLGIFA
jgi:hypothetical protein